MGVCSVGHLSLLLRSEGVVITHAAGKEEAAELLGERRLDLALVDISLPDGNGFAVCTEIRESQAIPVFFLTASGDETSVVTGLNMGADDGTQPQLPVHILMDCGATIDEASALQVSCHPTVTVHTEYLFSCVIDYISLATPVTTLL